MNSIKLCDGKYEFYTNPAGMLMCRRHGDKWRDFIGDNATHALFDHAIDLEAKLAEALREVGAAQELVEVNARLANAEERAETAERDAKVADAAAMAANHAYAVERKRAEAAEARERALMDDAAKSAELLRSAEAALKSWAAVFAQYFGEQTTVQEVFNLLEQKKAALKEAREDAERYRWLRAQNWDSSTICCVVDPRKSVKLGCDCPSLDRLDAFIKAAIDKRRRDHE